MVGRSQPQKKMETNPSEDFNAAEIMFLKSKNNELAKALSDTKVSLKQTMDERDYLQREMFSLNLRISELENYIQHIDQAALKSINALVASSNFITEIAQITRKSMRKSDANPVTLTTLRNSAMSQSPSTSKTQAVKPMIDGHVIYRPTISLRRVNEIPLEEIQRLRSSPQAINSNNTGNNSLLDQEENTENNTFHHLPASWSRSYNDLSNRIPTDNVESEGADEYADPSSNESMTDMVNNNRLHTIDELSEGLLNNSTRPEDDLSTIANASTNSVSIPGHTSQGALLSGVFRDVRVYLSPMQNVSDYLESLQGITTERGKIYPSKKPQRKHYSPRTVSLDENNQCVVTIKSSASSLDQSNNLPSINNSFEESNTSILTSTRIANNFDESCRTHNSSYIKKSPWSTNAENTTVTENRQLHNGSCENEWSKNTKWVKENVSNLQNYSSALATSSLSTAYDPLEGPSTLLDSDGSMKEKLETMSMLGLKLKSSIENPSDTPSSPASTVLKRRVRDQDDNVTPNKKNKSIFVTQRKLDIKKSTLLPKGILKRSPSLPRVSSSHIKKTKSIKRVSISPVKLKSKKTPLNKKSSLKTKRSTSDVKKRKSGKKKVKQELNISQSSSRTSVSTASSTLVSSSKKAKRKKKSEASSENESRTLSTTPQKSPKKKRNAKLKIQSLKEPSLGTKMRRSK